MKVLITGGMGYLGTIIAKHLPYEYRIVDLKAGQDYRDIKNLTDIDVVIHLAAIVGDQACAADPDLARKTNYYGLRKFLLKCKAHGVRLFIFASTCSVYGCDSIIDCYEESPVNPISLYATTKFAAERLILKHKSENFHPVILRFGTAFGLSPAIRYNLVLNWFAKQIKEGKDIVIHGGQQWRPFVHVYDIARAIYSVIEAPLLRVSGEIFNIANENINFKFLAEDLKKWFPSINIRINNEMKDKRSYRVNCRKALKILGWNPYITIKEGMEEIIYE